jgi:transketolase
MRTAFIETLCELAEQDERIWLLTGDLGYSVLELFAQRFPKRYVNIGVAEQNMTGVAAALALEGEIVFTYSIANFPVMRCLEQIRNDVCYHNLNVKVVAVGGGVAYGVAGYTHHAVEDLAVMPAMPNITVIAPGDPTEAGLATRAIKELDGPGYLRLGKARESYVYKTPPLFKIGKAITVREGNDITLISTGGILSEVLSAAEQLAPQFQTRVLSMPTVKPLDQDAVRKAADETKVIVTVEEHSEIGGLGDAVAEILIKDHFNSEVMKLALNSTSHSIVGSQSYLRQQFSLSAARIARTIKVNICT